MNTIRITSSKNLAGCVSVPGDKSISHRALILGSLADGQSQVENFLFGGDCLATRECLRQLGIETYVKLNGCIQILGKGLRGLKSAHESLNCIRSGTTIRLLTGLLAGQNFNSALGGDPQLLRRPMKRIVDPLEKMGAKIHTNGGFAPLNITGAPLRGTSHKLSIASAQVKSALILAGLFAEGETIVFSPGPSRDHTERMLTAMGSDLVHDGHTVTINPVSKLEPFSIKVPGDFSSAAFILAAGVLVAGSDILIKDVGINPTRTGFLDVIKEMGASFLIVDEYQEGNEPVAQILIKSSSLKGTIVNGNTVVRMIDEFPLLAVMASQAEGVTKVVDAGELRVKETDRVKTVVFELRKMGVNIKPLPDGFIVEGPTPLHGAVVDSHGDHRLAMSLAIAGLITQGDLVIKGAGCISDSFPGFVKIMKKLGGKID
jgi:3-phosphoshikimate 1-carboxyvinyltransferase